MKSAQGCVTVGQILAWNAVLWAPSSLPGHFAGTLMCMIIYKVTVIIPAPQMRS